MERAEEEKNAGTIWSRMKKNGIKGKKKPRMIPSRNVE
jgi:hypothetical protein